MEAKIEVINGQKYYPRTFETYWEFIKRVQKPASQKSKENGYNSSESGSEKFTGTESFDEAIRLATEGWDAGLKELPIEGGVAVDTGTEFVSAPVGSAVNIPNYILGVPNSMWQMREEREYNLEELTFYVCCDYNGNISSQKAMRYCKSIIEIINKYQRNYNVRIVGYFDGMFSGVRWVNEILIKDYDSRFVINNLAFAFHPSFLRRLWFRNLEQTEFCSSGYGGACYGGAVRDRMIKELKDGTKPKHKSILIPHIDGLSNGTFSEEKLDKFYF